MREFSEKEKRFLESMEECRIATSHNDKPHVKPVSFTFFKNTIYIATDYNTRTYKNLSVNPNVALTIDKYKHGAHKAVLVQGKAKIIDSGIDFKEIYRHFFTRFEWVRKDPWKEHEAPFLIIIPEHTTSWGL